MVQTPEDLGRCFEWPSRWTLCRLDWTCRLRIRRSTRIPSHPFHIAWTYGRRRREQSVRRQVGYQQSE